MRGTVSPLSSKAATINELFLKFSHSLCLDSNSIFKKLTIQVSEYSSFVKFSDSKCFIQSRIGRISTDETLTAEDVNKETGEFLWASDLPEPDPNKSYSVRFDLWGNFVTDSNLPTHLGLHHHGQEPEVGY